MNVHVQTAVADLPILECRNLSISYASRAGDIPAVIDFNLVLMRGEAHGLVGESGCGKSTIALAIMRYLGNAGRIVAGQILFQGRDIVAMGQEELRRIRGAAIAMIYQEPMASLNPAMTIGEQLIEVPMYHEGMQRRDAAARARAMLDRVRMADAERIMRSYPHQISGGQQQRIVIAMALLSNPQLLLLDEPTTALDVTVEAGIVDLIRGISAEFGTSMLYISHNLGLVRETCDRITVMYSGEAVETASVDDVFSRVRTRTAARWPRFPVSSRSPAADRPAVTSARAAPSSSPAAAMPHPWRCKPLQRRPGTRPAACGSRKSPGIHHPWASPRDLPRSPWTSTGILIGIPY
jgi:peptide/nickel transport system ATP-binding protein